VNIEERLAGVLVGILGPEAHALTHEDGPGTIAAWDSVNHLNLVLALEAEFGIQFTSAQIPALLSVGQILEHLRQE
jgi:acyl carrier protein